VALPRVRDFRGVSARSFDGRGNYALGLKEQIVFPEIDYDRGFGARHGHRHLHDGQDRRRSQGPAEGLRHALHELSCRGRTGYGEDEFHRANNKRIRLAKKFSARRIRLKAIANDESLPPEQRFAARLKLSEIRATHRRYANAIGAS